MSPALEKVSYRRPASTSDWSHQRFQQRPPPDTVLRLIPAATSSGGNSRSERSDHAQSSLPIHFSTTTTFYGTHCRSNPPNPTTPLSLKSAKFAHRFDATSLHTAHPPNPTHQSLISCEKISHQSSAIPSKPPHRFGQSYCRRAAYLLRDYAYQRKVPATSAARSKHIMPSALKFDSPAPTPTTAPALPLILSTSTSTASH